MQYRQRLIDGQLVFVQVTGDAETDLEPTAHPFDEKGKHVPSFNASKKAEREIEYFHDLYSGVYETSSIDGTTPSFEQFRIGHNNFCVNDDALGYENDDWSIYSNNDTIDDTISTVTAKTECDIWHSWLIPSWLRPRKTNSTRSGRMKKSGLEYDCDTGAESFTTATSSSGSISSSESFGTSVLPMTTTQLVANVILDEILEACPGDVELIDGKDNDTKLKSYKIVKERQREKVGLAFVANYDDGTVYICEIKKGSKFLQTGLQVGSRVVSINGKSVPENPKGLLKMLKQARGELVLVVQMPKPEVKVLLEGVRRENNSSKKYFCNR